MEGDDGRWDRFHSIPFSFSSKNLSIYLWNLSFSTIVHEVQVMSSPYVVPGLVHVFQAKEGSTRSQSVLLRRVVDRELVEKGVLFHCKCWEMAVNLEMPYYILMHPGDLVASGPSISKSCPFSSDVNRHISLCMETAFSTMLGTMLDMWLNSNQWVMRRVMFYTTGLWSFWFFPGWETKWDTATLDLDSEICMRAKKSFLRYLCIIMQKGINLFKLLYLMIFHNNLAVTLILFQPGSDANKGALRWEADQTWFLETIASYSCCSHIWSQHLFALPLRELRCSFAFTGFKVCFSLCASAKVLTATTHFPVADRLPPLQ